MVGNRQTQIFFLNSKSLNNFASFGRLDCFFLINSRIYEHLKQFLHFLTTNLWKNIFFFLHKILTEFSSKKMTEILSKYHVKHSDIFYQQKKILFFSSFTFNMVWFLQKVSYKSEIHWKDTLGSKSKNCRRNYQKTQQKLILWNFGKFFDFFQFFWFMRPIYGIFELWETNKLKKKNLNEKTSHGLKKKIL